MRQEQLSFKYWSKIHAGRGESFSQVLHPDRVSSVSLHSKCLVSYILRCFVEEDPECLLRIEIQDCEPRTAPSRNRRSIVSQPQPLCQFRKCGPSSPVEELDKRKSSNGNLRARNRGNNRDPLAEQRVVK